MSWIVTKKSTNEIIEVLIKNPDWTLSELSNIIPINYGGTDKDYLYLQLSKNDESRIIDKHEFDLQLINDELNISFLKEDIKPILKISSDVDSINGDNIDIANILFEIWDSNLNSIDLTYNDSLELYIRTPNGSRTILIDIVNGTANYEFITDISGKWIFPINTNNRNFKLGSTPVIINVIDIKILKKKGN